MTDITEIKKIITIKEIDDLFSEGLITEIEMCQMKRSYYGIQRDLLMGLLWEEIEALN